MVEIKKSKKDKGECLEVLTKSFSKNDSVDVALYVKDRWDAFDVYGAYEDGKVVGTLVCDKSENSIVLLGVLNEYQNKGIGSQLVQYVLNVFEEEGAIRVETHCPLQLKDYFLDLGFVVVEGTNMDDDFTFVHMEYLFVSKWLGKKVHVQIDQPYGSWHSHIPDLLLPCNVGMVEDVLKDTGDIIDAYVLNVFEPVETYDGIVIAILVEQGSDYVRFIVSDKNDTKDEIIEQIGSMEEGRPLRFLQVDCSKS